MKQLAADLPSLHPSPVTSYSTGKPDASIKREVRFAPSSQNSEKSVTPVEVVRIKLPMSVFLMFPKAIHNPGRNSEQTVQCV